LFGGGGAAGAGGKVVDETDCLVLELRRSWIRYSRGWGEETGDYRNGSTATRHENDTTVFLELKLHKSSCERFMALEGFGGWVVIEVV
jgi:hypothetical protein